MQDDLPTPSAAAEAVARLRAAIEAEDLYDDLFDTADAIVRSEVQKGQLKPPDDQTEFVLELVGEALETAHEIANMYDPELAAVPWLIGIVKKKLLSRSRDKRRRREGPLLDTQLAASGDGQPTEEDLFGLLESNDERSGIEARLVWEKLQPQLPERYAGVLYRWHVEGETVAEIAKAYGISVGYVYTLHSRALRAALKILNR